MSSVNLASQELALKIVYYGPGLGGKTTCLQYVHRTMRAGARGDLVSLATGSDRTLYFDFLPLHLPKLGGFKVRVALYTVPGQVHYNATRKLVLAGADGVVFVADSQRERLLANAESMSNLAENLTEQGRSLSDVPLVYQYNKRDAATAIGLDELKEEIGGIRAPGFETVATEGRGVFDALKTIIAMVLKDLRRKTSAETPTPEANELLGLGTPRDASTSAPSSAATPAPSSAATPAIPAIRARSESPPTPPAIAIVPGAAVASAASAASAAERITAQSLGELASAMEHVQLEHTGTESGSFTYERRPRSFSALIEDYRLAGAITLAEEALDGGRWDDAVRHADKGYRRKSVKMYGVRDHEVYVRAAFVAGVPPERFQRFSELSKRVETGGAVTSTEAIFAVFFLTDFALRLKERAQRKQ